MFDLLDIDGSGALNKDVRRAECLELSHTASNLISCVSTLS